ncbi:MAG: PQQ-binding-like beta-propeller repeat protein [Acidobacteria bacterium]|nr:PQQ-binding-like beta-propeller repeat protein [Acidobacteriota bacterium]
MRASSIAVALAIAAGGSVAAADWPQWRGPHGTGVADEKDLPVRWSATENVAWTAALGGVGVSTPIVVGDRVFVTSQIGAGVRRPGNHPRLAQGMDAAGAGERALGASRGTPAGAADDRTFFLLEAFHRADGRRLWEYRVEAAGPLPGVHDKHNLASPSPVTDGQLVYAWFGTGQLTALDMSGRRVWERHLGKEIAPFTINWGHASSPALYQDLLILLCDHTPASYLLAVDKRTGKDRWKADRGRGRSSYSTPFVVEAATGAELIVNSSERVDAYDPKTGAFLWHVGGSNQYPIPSPAFHNGILYFSRGYRSGPYMAVRPGGRGDVSASHVVWEVPTGAPYVSSLVYDAGLIYMANDVGAITVVDAETGRKVWQQRVGGIFSASPVAADGKIYFVSETGETIVMRSGREPAVIARNDLGERAVASLAVSNGQLFIRTDDRLFCIGKAR